MKLYRKKLDSVEALKREKIRLRYERRHTNASDLNPLAEMGHTKVSSSAKEGLFGTLMELFSATNNLQLVAALGKPLLRAVKKRRAKSDALWLNMGKPKKKSFLKKIVTEIAVSYAIGKAVQMVFLGSRLLIKRRKAARLKAKIGG
jgi:hypothetical protein